MKKTLWIVCTLLAFGAEGQVLTPAKPEDAGMSSKRLERIDQVLQDYVSRNQVPGAVGFIARRGKVVYHKAFGYSDTETKSLLKKTDIFRIASQTKAITSLAVMMLWEEGRFLLDEPVSKYIPEFKNPKVLVTLNWSDTSYTTTPAKSEITVRQLLTHTSGLDYAAIGSQEFKAVYARAGVPAGIGTSSERLADKMKVLGSLPLKHNPGEQYTYSLSTDVLGYLVEVVSGLSLDEFFRKRIFEPLGMSDTWFYLPKDRHNRLVALHQSEDGGYRVLRSGAFENADPNYPNLPGTYYSGGAGLSSTVEDYAKFLQLFLNNGVYNGQRLLSRKTVELMLTNQLQPPLTNTFGLGFGLETKANDYQSVVSEGSFNWGGAFSTSYMADPKEGLIVILYTNIFASSSGGLADRFRILAYSAVND
jgi:CubicO group peptidase (beta-lactamase class C family)